MAVGLIEPGSGIRPFRDHPIARKTLTLGLVPAIFALLVAILASLLSTYMTARSNQHADVDRRRRSSPTTPAPGSRSETSRLSTRSCRRCDVRPNIDMVCVYDETGASFSRFQRATFICPPAWPAAMPATAPVGGETGDGGQRTASAPYISAATIRNLFNWMRQQSVVGFLALVCGILSPSADALRAAVSVARRLSIWRRPSIELRPAATTRRAPRRRTGDEVGRLVHLVQHDARCHPEKRRSSETSFF